jgi:benzoyl-CoA reductase/2-hydroxyglutaryl-CoA dehydratase subunit BcrC/BadD/HgdB
MSLATLSKIQDRLAARPAEVAAQRANGKKVVGWQGYNIPEELFLALDIIPVRISKGGDDKLVELGSRYISTKNCVFVRETLGLFAEGKDDYIKLIDFVAFDTTCLQTYRTAELLEYFFDRKVSLLGVPRNFYWEEAKTYYSKEVDNFIKELEELSGNKLDQAKLTEAIEVFREIRSLILALYEYQAVDNEVIGWNDVYDVVLAANYLDKKEYLGLLRELVAELEKAALLKITEYSGPFTNDARIFISGSVIPDGDVKLRGIIADVGGKVVGDDLWSGLIPWLDVNVQEYTPEALAKAYIERTPHGALPYLDLKTDRRLAKLDNLLTHFKANGLIYHTLRYCDPYTFKAKETKDVLALRDMPFLEIHTEYAGSDYEAIHTRVEAFGEMLASRVYV